MISFRFVQMLALFCRSALLARRSGFGRRIASDYLASEELLSMCIELKKILHCHLAPPNCINICLDSLLWLTEPRLIGLSCCRLVHLFVSCLSQLVCRYLLQLGSPRFLKLISSLDSSPCRLLSLLPCKSAR